MPSNPISDNRLYKVLGFLSSGEKYQWEVEDMMALLNSARRVKYNAPFVRWAFKQMEDQNLLRKLPGTAWDIEGNDGINRIREAYEGKMFKEKSTSTDLIFKIISAIGTVATITFAIVSYVRQNTIEKQKIEMQGFADHVKADSISLVNLSTKVSKLYSSDSSYRLAIKKGGFKYDSITNTITTPRINIQEIEQGSSGLQNNAPNYGNQAGRDINISNERVLSESELKELVEFARKRMNESSIKCLNVYFENRSNGNKI